MQEAAAKNAADKRIRGVPKSAKKSSLLNQRNPYSKTNSGVASRKLKDQEQNRTFADDPEHSEQARK